MKSTGKEKEAEQSVEEYGAEIKFVPERHKGGMPRDYSELIKHISYTGNGHGENHDSDRGIEAKKPLVQVYE